MNVAGSVLDDQQLFGNLTADQRAQAYAFLVGYLTSEVSPEVLRQSLEAAAAFLRTRSCTNRENVSRSVVNAEHGHCAGQYRGSPCPRPVLNGLNWCSTHLRQRTELSP